MVLARSLGHNRNRRRALAKVRHQETERTTTNNNLAAAFSQITGLDPGFDPSKDLHIYQLKRQSSNLDLVQEIQARNIGNPQGFMSLSELKHAIPTTLELKDGYNLLIDSDDKLIFGVVYYRHLSKLDTATQRHVLGIMTLADKVTRTTRNIIKTNGASHAGTQKATPHGVMAEYGWRQSFNPGGTIDRYVAAKSSIAKNNIKVLDQHMALVARFFEQRFKVLHSVAGQSTLRHARLHNIPRFDEINLQAKGNLHGMNMFSATRAGFCNTAHRDRDTSPYNIGAFFAGPVHNNKFSHQLKPIGKHLHGGEFYWAEYGVVVGHAKEGSWAEVIWRGHQDYHGTLSCWLEPGSTFGQVDRWGSSCQITGAVQNRIRLMKEREIHTDSK